MKAKKAIAVLVAAGMILGTTGCGSSDSSELLSSIAEQATTETSDISDILDKLDETEQETVQETEAKAQETEEAFNPEIMGSTTDSGYENTYFNMGVTIDSDWEIADEESMDEVSKQAKAAAESGNQEEFEAISDQITLFQAFKSDGTSIRFMMQKEEGAGLFSEDAMLEAAKEEIENNPEEMGMEDWEILNAETTTMTIAGQEKKILHLTAKLNGVSMDICEFVVLRGNYMMLVAAGGLQNEVYKDVLNMLYLVN